MTAQAVFIDLSNFYGSLIRSKLSDVNNLRDYFINWLDLDLLVSEFAYSSPNTWVFYSGGRIGSSDFGITGKLLKNYIARINRLNGITARDVNIPGEQREKIFGRCDNCGSEIEEEWRSEKGVDASLIVHLFDTMEYWDTAYLVSSDADFAPAVASLRRRGKVVIGAGFTNASSLLIQEYYSYINLVETFLRADVALYTLFKDDGILAKWLGSVEPESTLPPGTLQVKVHITSRDNTMWIDVEGSCNVESIRGDLVNCIGNNRLNFNEYNNGQRKLFGLTLNKTHLIGFQRRMSSLLMSVQGRRKITDSSGQMMGYYIGYQYNHDNKKYEYLENQRDREITLL